MSYLASCSTDDAKRTLQDIAVIKQNKLHRQHNRSDRKGYSKDRTMRHILSFHPSVLFHPEFGKYFDPMLDAHERKKHLYAFARKHPEYLVVDKI